MNHFICTTCGTQHAATHEPPAACCVCEDERQYVGWGGQQWTTLEALRATHQGVIRTLEPHLHSIGMEPAFAIGQRALFIEHPQGNVLWDCIPLIDDSLQAAIGERGGLAAIAISHPHYYTTMVEWAEAFDCPVYLHAADRQWVMRDDRRLVFWTGESQRLSGELTLIRCGGHFDGGAVLHWPAGAAGRGALLSGDILQVVQDRRWLSFMYSYPNFIPLSAAAVRRIEAAVAPYAFDRIYGAFWEKEILQDAKSAVGRSVERYIQALERDA